MIDKLKILHTKGLNDSEISKILNIKRQKVSYERNKLNLKSNFTYKSRIKIDKEILINLTQKGLTDLEISKILKVKQGSIWCARKRYSIVRKPFSYDKEINLSKFQLNILKGCLLGDGSLSKENKNPRFSCEHSINQKDYCFWKYSQFKEIGFIYKESKRKTPDKRNGKFYESATMKCGARINFLEIYNSLYINNIKCITKEFLKDFNNISLAIMFMDDGTKTKQSIKIATNCFNENDLEVFINFCKNKWNIEFNIHGDNGIYLPVKYLNKFINIVKPFMHQSMMYKLQSL